MSHTTTRPLARALRLAIAPVLLTLLVSGGCKSNRPTTYVVVTLAASVGETIPGITVFRSTLTNDGEMDEQDFEAPGGNYTLTDNQGITYAIDARRRTGMLTIFVEALDNSANVIGTGTGTVVLTEPAETDAVTKIAIRISSTVNPITDSGPMGTDSGLDSGPPASCGDGVVDMGEECDDGNMDPADYCDNCLLQAPQAETPMTIAAGEPRVVMRDNGEILVIWTDISGLDREVYGRRFDAEGAPLDAAEVRLDSPLGNGTWSASLPDVAMDPATGSTLVAWTLCRVAPPCGDGVCEPGTENCGACPADCGMCMPTCADPMVMIPVCDPGENCMNCPQDCGIACAAPERCDIYARLFDGSLNPVANTVSGSDVEFRVNTDLVETHHRPAVARRPGGWVITWETVPPGTNGGGEIWARLHATDGTPLMDPSGVTGTDPFPVLVAADAACWPTVGAGPGGDFVIAWGAPCGMTNPLESDEIRARLFPASGAPAGPFTTSSDGNGFAGPVRSPGVAFASNNNFMMVWEAANGTDSNIDAVMYDSGGISLGPVDVAGANTPGIDRRDPRVGYNSGDGAAGLFIVGWRETSGTGALTSLGLRQRLIHPSGTTILTSFEVEPMDIAAGDSPSPRVLDVDGSLSGFWTVAWRNLSGVRFQLYPVGFRP